MNTTQKILFLFLEILCKDIMSLTIKYGTPRGMLLAFFKLFCEAYARHFLNFSKALLAIY